MNGTPHVHGVHVVVMLAVACGALAVACGVPLAEDGEPDPDAYLTPVAVARENGLRPYWLGPSFDAGDLTYSYIEAVYPEGIGGVGVSGAELGYYTTDGEEWGVTVKTAPIGEWPLAESAVREPRGSSGLRAREDVVVGGVSGELLIFSSPTRPTNGYVLIIETDESAVVVTVPSGGSASPGGPDVNPLIEYQSFLSVMQSLRPYPE
jgi:hypothetical protein